MGELIASHIEEEDASVATRKSLLSRLKNREDQDGWTVFFDTYWKLIYKTALTAGLNDAEAKDVVQETLVSLTKNIAGFQYDPSKGSFRSWLLTLTRWRIEDQRRKRQHEIVEPRRDSERLDETATIDRIPMPDESELEAAWNLEWEQNLIEAALERVKRKVDPTQFQIFDLYVLKRWTVLQTARMLKVNPGLVYLVKHRMSRLIKHEVSYLRTKVA